MENNKRKNIPEINEEMMMNLMLDGVKKEGLKLPLETKDANSQDAGKIEQLKDRGNSKNKDKAKKINYSDYESIFFKRAETNARDGKTVYIRPEFHEKLFRIVQVIGEDKITIYGYLDNLLEFHFQEFGDQIIKSYNDKYKPIF